MTSRKVKSQIGFVICNDTINLFINNTSYMIDSSHPNFKMVERELSHKQRPHILVKLLSVKRAIESFMKGRIKVDVDKNEIKYHGKVVEPVITDKIISFMKQGLNPRPLILFLDKLMKNPSHRALTEAFKFIKNVGLPIDKNGNLIAYKAVQQDWMDIHSGTILNKIGKVIKIERNLVDDNFGVACSDGLHVGDLSYARAFGGSSCRMILVRVDPQNIVSVPSDESCRKCRVCEYKVIAEYNGSDPISDLIYVNK